MNIQLNLPGYNGCLGDETRDDVRLVIGYGFRGDCWNGEESAKRKMKQKQKKSG